MGTSSGTIWMPIKELNHRSMCSI